MTEVTLSGMEGEGQGPEYEAIALLGSSCDVNDLPAVAKASYLCNDLGMDTMDMGGTMACAMELFERGYLSEEEVGCELTFGNATAMLELITKTGLREGFGDIMAEGGYRMAEKYGHPELFMGVKKQGFAGYDPRAMKGMGLGYATSNRGACHCRTGIAAAEMSDTYSTEGKPAMLKQAQDIRAVIDSAGLCMRGPLGTNNTPEAALSMLEPIVGAGYDLESMLLTGERIWNLERLFNIKAGLTLDDDSLPPRMLKEPMPEGPAKGLVHELNEMLPEYYDFRGWDKNGIPLAEKLETLGIAEEGV
jgi:aldehyde:ferredoxin oxidoreductase